MRKIIVRLMPWEKHRVRRLVREEGTEDGRRRYRVILALHKGLHPRTISEVEDISLVTVYRVSRRYLAGGLPALRDGRSHRPAPKSTDRVLSAVEGMIGEDPRSMGYGRSNWSCELLARELFRRMGLSLHRSWVHVLLHRVRARWGRARPSVRRLNPHRWRQWGLLARRLRRVGSGEVVLFADEVDIDLNPRIGFAWTRWGEQLEVPTPGQNQKRYLAGALNPDSGHAVFVEGPRKTSDLFIALLDRVSAAYRWARRIHLVVDNYIIHFSHKTSRVLAWYEGRIQLHPLPTYSPELNPIERLWKQLHDRVTRNHRFPSMARLMGAVCRFLRTAIPFRTKNPIYLRITS